MSELRGDPDTLQRLLRALASDGVFHETEPGVFEHTEHSRHLLAPGAYFLTFAAHVINQQTFDTQPDALTFEVAETGCIRTKRNDRRVGVVTPVFDWTIDRVS